MDLKDLTEQLLQETSSIFEASKASRTVDWAFPEVTILSTSQNSQQAGQGGTTDDSAKTEIIDGGGQEGEGGEGGESGQGEGGDGSQGGGSDSASQVKPGSIIQDMETGEYGEVISVDKDGNVDWKPVDKSEIDAKGLARTRNKRRIIRKGGIDGFIG